MANNDAMTNIIKSWWPLIVTIFVAGGFFTKQQFVNDQASEARKDLLNRISKNEGAIAAIQSGLNQNLTDIKVELRALRENLNSIQQQLRWTDRRTGAAPTNP